ncbi:MAG TPA: diphosphomevalonate decarboxylase [Thermoanaerobaculia bacterium]|nr:diphosphomevalonate decarboxylase [Thermoanaerobaculia bacterium]
MKASVEAPSNIAFVKYWGARDLERAIPNHPSISMSLSACRSLCTAEFRDGEDAADEVWLVEEDGSRRRPEARFSERACRHLDQLRRWGGMRGRFVVGTRNTFPSAAGIASSASGFAALTLAGVRAMGRAAEPPELSSLARLSGSGSAARSALGGYVEWPRGVSDEECYAFALAEASHWDLRDVVVVVESAAKKVASRDGHRLAASSPHYARRLELLPERLDVVRAAIRDRDLDRLGPVIEEEGIELHLIAMSSRPPVFYWNAATIDFLACVRELREQRGLSAWSTLDAGANVHVICAAAEEPAVAEALAAAPGVERLIRDRVGAGPRALESHLI